MNRFISNLSLLLLSICMVSCGIHSNEDPTTEVSSQPTAHSTISYEIIGEGAPLVMFAGTSVRMNQWPPALIKALAKENQLILLDYPGIGASTPYEENFTFSTIGEDVAVLLESLEIDSATILGWSLGGWIAQQFTLEYPGLVNHLILVGTDPGGEFRAPDLDSVIELFDSIAVAETQSEQNQLRSQLLDMMFPDSVGQETRDALHELYTQGGDILPSVTMRQLEVSGDWVEPTGGVYHRLSDIFQPVLVIHGTEDIIVPTANSQLFVDKLPNVELQLVENGGHGVLYQYPEAVAGRISRFLRFQP